MALWASWYLTDRCNLACPYCFTRSSPSVPDEVDAQGRRRIVTEFAASSVTTVSLGGGEPMILPDLSELAAMLLDAGKKVRLYTNGTLVRGGWSDTLDALDLTMVSYDDVRPGHHAVRRGGIELDRALAYLAKRQVRFGTITMATEATVDGICRTGSHLASLGAVLVSIAVPRPVGRGRTVEPLSPTARARLVDQVLALRSLVASEQVVIEVSGIYAPRLFQAGVIDRMPACLCGEARFAVSPGGYGYPCGQIPYLFDRAEIESSFGEPPNLLESSVAEIMKSPFFGRWRLASRKKPDECLDCAFLLYCDSGCRALTYGRFGTFERRDPSC